MKIKIDGDVKIEQNQSGIYVNIPDKKFNIETVTKLSLKNEKKRGRPKGYKVKKKIQKRSRGRGKRGETLNKFGELINKTHSKRIYLSDMMNEAGMSNGGTQIQNAKKVAEEQGYRVAREGRRVVLVRKGLF